MRNLDNLREPVESPKSWNSIGYICPKNTFLQLKHYIQRIYLTLFSTTVKIYQIPYVIFETISHFSRHKLSLFYLLKHYILLKEISYQKHPMRIFRFSTIRVKIYQVIHDIFQTKSEFFFKVWITLQSHGR